MCIPERGWEMEMITSNHEIQEGVIYKIEFYLKEQLGRIN